MFSAALGLVQLLAPRWLLARIGIAGATPAVAITRLVGVRELSVVPGLLGASAPVGWLAARVTGDLMDIGLLRAARGMGGANARLIGGATGAVVAILGIDLAAALLTRRDARRRSRHPRTVVRSVTVNRPVEELYRFWRDLENLPRIMPHLESVETRGGSTSHWVARAPLNSRVEWDADIVEDRPNEVIAWRSLEGSSVRNAGTVRFQPAPGDRGTEIRVEMEYDTPGGPIGSVVALLSGEEPRQQVSDALRRFKQVMETGEPIRSEATATGHKVLQRPAQPMEEVSA